MESLSDTTWDVVIAGTGLPQALLALSLSRSDRKVLHVDKNDYYGGQNAAFSLSEAEEWTKKVNISNHFVKYRNAQINIPQAGAVGLDSNIAKQSRKYTLSLSPQLIYAQSKLLPALVSSRVHTQLEFQAVGSWWVYRSDKLQRIPSSREDVFADDTLSRRDKIVLMKFLRSVVKEPDSEDSRDSEGQAIEDDDRPLATLLGSDFKLSQSLQQPLLALSLSPMPVSCTKSSYALPRIKRHMTSIGAFGPGFGAVLPKYGGNAEIAQVGCRAGAVGGGVYVLGAGVIGQEPTDSPSHVKISLSNGEIVTTSYVAGNMDDLSSIDWTGESNTIAYQEFAQYMHYIGIISSPLKQLFPKTSENGPLPAGSIVLFDDADESGDAPPLYLQVHSEDTGECPGGQCIIYGSVLMLESDNDESARERLHHAIEKVISTCDTTATLLWEMSYVCQSPSIDGPPFSASFTTDSSGRIMAFQPYCEDIAFDDILLETVKAVWEKIMGPLAEESEFMRFDERPGEEIEE